jgi:hypothetical protein
MSPPEKIFEVFATVKKENDIFMSHYDLFRAVVPYGFSTKKSEDEVIYPIQHQILKEKEQKEFKSSALIEFADADGDGTISLYEYYFFVTFLQGKS